MQLGQALDRLDEIHGVLARSEHYRGYRPALVAATGLLAVLGAVAQQGLLGDRPAERWPWYWVGIAAAAALITALGIAWDYVRREDPFERRRTREAVGQLLPALGSGAVVTAAFLAGPAGLDRWLPGLWCLLFGTAVASSRPYLPRRTGWVALGYLVAGTAGLLWPEVARSPWFMGGVFGALQVAAAVVLHQGLTRSGDARR